MVNLKSWHNFSFLIKNIAKALYFVGLCYKALHDVTAQKYKHILNNPTGKWLNKLCYIYHRILYSYRKFDVFMIGTQ